ncbi:hypothetical protein HMPREF0653_02830 [Prevotella disiens JCM 6334 = ATCC 29426]|uniref:Uncharacterized protein n=1 Tax=Prevotella disiens JCM 6334 = ATCC 29426 TaxID=1235811 RepID=A0ABN0NN44_9BACT|nr:hypothetical protein HMPREF0653_02830 [Prevotella disiens JCM 6334 = ATCC 29426]
MNLKAGKENQEGDNPDRNKEERNWSGGNILYIFRLFSSSLIRVC